MTPDQTDRATTWLARRSITCGCGGREFTLKDDLVEAPPADDGGTPLVMAVSVCINCARIHSYDAQTMGLI